MRISDWSSDVCSSDLPPSPLNSTYPASYAQNYPQILWIPSQDQGITPFFTIVSHLAGLSGTPFIGINRATESRIAIFARSEEHTSELQSLMRTSYDVFCFKKKKPKDKYQDLHTQHP